MVGCAIVFSCGELLPHVPDALRLCCHLFLSFSQRRLRIMASLHIQQSFACYIDCQCVPGEVLAAALRCMLVAPMVAPVPVGVVSWSP